MRSIWVACIVISSGCGTVQGGVARQDVASVETGKAVEGSDRLRKNGRIGFSPTQQGREISASWAGREVDDCAQAAEASPALSLVEIRAERPPPIRSGDHRAPRAARRVGFQVLETARLPVNARAYAYREDGEVSEILET